MATHAIRISDDLSVIVTFATHDVERLTEDGFVTTEEVTVSINDARGLALIAGGSSLRAPEDEPDKQKGYRVALQRALESAPREVRTILHEALTNAFTPQVEPELPVWFTDAFHQARAQMVAAYTQREQKRYDKLFSLDLETDQVLQRALDPFSDVFSGRD